MLGRGGNAGSQFRDCDRVLLRFNYFEDLKGVRVGEDGLIVLLDYKGYGDIEIWGYRDKGI